VWGFQVPLRGHGEKLDGLSGEKLDGLSGSSEAASCAARTFLPFPTIICVFLPIQLYQVRKSDDFPISARGTMQGAALIEGQRAPAGAIDGLIGALFQACEDLNNAHP
jgi:hypothetical protein